MGEGGKRKLPSSISPDVFSSPVAAITVGILSGAPVLDLNYIEDAQAEVDLNVVMNQEGDFIEIQGTTESSTFSRDDLNSMLELAESGIQQLILSHISTL